MASFHKVQAGDTLSSIAFQYGFTSGNTIWEDPKNAQLKRQRPDPNLLFPGDILFIPDKKEKQEARGTAQTHSFTVKTTTKTLRIALEDEEGARLANTKYNLKIGDKIMQGTTDGQGILIHEIPLDATVGELILQGHTWPLQIGHLNPIENTPDQGISGIKARLRNLGYYQGEINDQSNDVLTASIRAFQEDNKLTVDGNCNVGSPTLAKLKEKHGC